MKLMITLTNDSATFANDNCSIFGSVFLTTFLGGGGLYSRGVIKTNSEYILNPLKALRIQINMLAEKAPDSHQYYKNLAEEISILSILWN